MEVWLTKLDPDIVGQPYVDIRAHKAFWQSLASLASSKVAELETVIQSGNFDRADIITEMGLDRIVETQQFFNEKYKVRIVKE